MSSGHESDSTATEATPVEQNEESVNKDTSCGDVNFLSQFGDCHTISMTDFMTIWKNYDTDKSGFIEVDAKVEGEESEFEKFMYDLVEIVFNEKMTKESTKNVSEAFVKEYNTGEKGKFGMSEMMDILPVEESGLQKLVVECKMSSLDVDKIFEHYDADNSGNIQEEELEQLVKDLVKKSSEGGVDEILDSEVADHKAELLTLADKDGDGQISKAELMLLVKLFLR